MCSLSLEYTFLLWSLRSHGRHLIRLFDATSQYCDPGRESNHFRGARRHFYFYYIFVMVDLFHLQFPWKISSVKIHMRQNLFIKCCKNCREASKIDAMFCVFFEPFALTCTRFCLCNLQWYVGSFSHLRIPLSLCFITLFTEIFNLITLFAIPPRRHTCDL
jgi:hypothetical protein